MLPASNQGMGMNIGFPDVCLTPAAPAPLPIPYPNLGMNAMAMPFCPNIFMSFIPGQNMAAKPLMTNGDNAGVAHPLCMQPGGTTMGNPKILLTGLPAAHMLVPTYGNNFNNPLGAKLVPSITNVLLCALGPDAPCEGTTRWSQAALETTARELWDLPAPSLGITTTPAQGGLRVVHVRRGEAGARAGLRPGDLLVEIAGAPAAELSDLPQVSPDRALELAFERGGARRSCSLRWEGAREALAGRVRGQVGWIEVRRFPLATAQLLDAEIERLVQAGARSLVLDLRGNPGGALAAALEAAGLFLREGAPLVRLEPREGRGSLVAATGSAPWEGLPLVVLVDDQTASAGEVLAAALLDQQRAEVIGQRTYGKGTAESPGGAWLKVGRTTGAPLAERGLQPHREVSPDQSEDLAWERALRAARR